VELFAEDEFKIVLRDLREALLADVLRGVALHVHFLAACSAEDEPCEELDRALSRTTLRLAVVVQKLDSLLPRLGINNGFDFRVLPLTLRLQERCLVVRRARGVVEAVKSFGRWVEDQPLNCQRSERAPFPGAMPGRIQHLRDCGFPLVLQVQLVHQPAHWSLVRVHDEHTLFPAVAERGGA
jgi:hypothetical protein